ncbi:MULTISPECIES: hypothetical protein [unclassified Arthrobacter]|uniref:hypothetical protein n=1 Tax=unclassified Arthrobacter TaxID=235627 RepID=UPI003394994B
MPQHPDGKNQLPVAPDGAASPPPRPGLSYWAPAPIEVIPPTPRGVSLARVLWLLSFVAGVAVIVGSFLARTSHLERLRAVVDKMAPGGDANAISTSTAIVFWSSLSVLLLLIVLQVVLLAVIFARRGWARWLLFLLLTCQIPAMAVAAAFLVPEGDAGSTVLLLWAAQLVLAFVGLLVLFLPAAGRWFRSRLPRP